MKSQKDQGQEKHEQQVRGPALRQKMNESEQYGETYRATHPEDETQKTQTGHKKVPNKVEIESR